MSKAHSLTLPAPAKLNLFLHITGQRADGYHELQTIFQLLDLGDQLCFTINNQQGARLSCNLPELEGEDNLILQAVAALEQHSGKTLNVDIHLNKVLPMGGGIGGGSSDCATTLLGLNHLFNLQIPQAELLQLGQQLGADVPVFILGKTSWAEGIGEQLTPMQRPQQSYVIVHPNIHVSTPVLFKSQNLKRNTTKVDINADMSTLGHNDFEPLVRQLYPEIEQLFQQCSNWGTPKLTGTGACLYIETPAEKTASIAAAVEAGTQNCRVFTANGVNFSAVHQQLAFDKKQN